MGPWQRPIDSGWSTGILEPAKIFVAILGGACDVAKVLDVGLLSVAAGRDFPRAAESTVGGNPSFMSPEQAAGGVVDSRTDIYALGAILYFILTGKSPFEKVSRGVPIVVPASALVRPPPQIGAQVPGDLEAVVLRCLATAPADRYLDSQALVTAPSTCDCTAEWDESRAEKWWLEQASRQLPQDATGAGLKDGREVESADID